MSDEREVLLRVEHLGLKRDNTTILHDVNLTVAAGGVHAVLGLNGSGKSSLAYVLMGCAGYKPDEGRIIFAGHDITTATISQRARLGLTLAWQEPARFEGLLVGDYLTAGAPNISRDQLWDALESVDLPPLAYLRRPVNSSLSGGERKRIELASVFTMQPRLAILDEPDSGVDTMTLDDIASLIRRMASQGTAVLLITHRDEIVAAADTASLMCQGSIIHNSTPADVRRYYGLRCRLHSEALGAQPWVA